MNFSAKYLLLFIVLISAVHVGFAQDSSKTGTTGEIVMTKAELQSFLNKIAALKKQHINRQETAGEKKELKLRDLHEVYKSKEAEAKNNAVRNEGNAASVQQYNTLNEQLLFKELELINARLNSLMLGMEVLKINAKLHDAAISGEPFPVRTSQQKQPEINIETPRQPIVIQQESPPQVYVNPALRDNTAISSKQKQEEQPVQEKQPNDSLFLAQKNEQSAP